MNRGDRDCPFRLFHSRADATRKLTHSLASVHSPYDDKFMVSDKEPRNPMWQTQKLEEVDHDQLEASSVRLLLTPGRDWIGRFAADGPELLLLPVNKGLSS